MKIPSHFLTRVNAYFGEESEDFVTALSQPPSLSIRLNPLKPISVFDQCEAVPWCTEGKYLNQRPDFTLDPLFHAGTYYVQEASSMFLSHIIKYIFDLSKSYTILDLCAAPGGKSTLLSSVFSDKSLITANEVISGRISPLIENCTKWGKANIIISNNDPSDFQKLPSFFDLVVVDAPCSGEGMFRKDHEAANHWSLNNIQLCEARQKRILEVVQTAVANEGFLIYCTCTFSPEENEENLKSFIQQHPEFESVQIPANARWGIVEKKQKINDNSIYSYHFYPHKIKGEGFFISCLKKKTLSPSLPPKERDRPSRKNETSSLKGEGRNFEKKKGSKLQLLAEKEKILLKKWIQEFDQYEYYIDWKGEINAIGKEKLNVVSLLMQTLKVKQAGIHIGKIIKDELIPAHHLATSTIISNEVPFIQFTKPEAIQYLAKQNILSLSTNNQGWQIVKYNGINLGWIKAISNRINNYYPHEYRIRKAIL